MTRPKEKENLTYQNLVCRSTKPLLYTQIKYFLQSLLRKFYIVFHSQLLSYLYRKILNCNLVVLIFDSFPFLCSLISQFETGQTQLTRVSPLKVSSYKQNTYFLSTLLPHSSSSVLPSSRCTIYVVTLKSYIFHVLVRISAFYL